jgi:hypothetical protein
MIDPASEQAVAAARWRGDLVRPLPGGYCFDAIPETIAYLAGAAERPALPPASLGGLEAPYERVLLVLADALGWHRLTDFADEPFVRRLLGDGGHLVRLTTQFPSTTTAHVTTLCTGRPVGATGFYEWFQYHEAVDGLVGPLLYARPGEPPGSLDVEPAAFYDFGETYVQSLVRRGVEATTFQNAMYAASPFSQYALEGARVVPFAEPGEALRLAAEVERGFVFAYVDTVDFACHHAGPGSADATAATRAVLAGLEQLVANVRPGTLLAVTADHGHVAADPARCLYLNELWPELPGLLTLPGVAGSPRDVFLHVRPGRADEVVAGLRERLGEQAIVEPIEVLIADGLFGQVSERLRRRLGDVAVLPAEGHEAWWHAPPAFEQHLLGHHGGLSAEEAHTYLGLVAV